MRHLTQLLSLGSLAAIALTLSGCSPPANSPKRPVVNSSTPKAAPEKPADKPAEKPGDKPADKPAGETKVSLQAVDKGGFQRLLAAQKGKVVLVDFWATWCEPCVKLLPHTIEVSHKYPAKDLAVITMSLDDNVDAKRAQAEKLLEEKKATTLNLISTLDLEDSFSVYEIPGGIPYLQIYDRTGKLRYKFATEEEIKPESVDLKLRELMMEKEPGEK